MDRLMWAVMDSKGKMSSTFSVEIVVECAPGFQVLPLLFSIIHAYEVSTDQRLFQLPITTSKSSKRSKIKQMATSQNGHMLVEPIVCWVVMGPLCSY